MIKFKFNKHNVLNRVYKTWLLLLNPGNAPVYKITKLCHYHLINNHTHVDLTVNLAR